MSLKGGKPKQKQGQGNQGWKQSNRRRFTNKKPEKKKKTLTDYVYNIGSSSQASDYETTTDFVINHIKKTYESGRDIANALETLTPVNTALWRPSLQVSVIPGNDDDAVAQRELEDKEFEMIFKNEVSWYGKRMQQYEDNLVKAYALLREQCSPLMWNKIKTSKEFRIKIMDDPIELLKIIKQNALNYKDYRYPIAIVADLVKNLFNRKTEKVCKIMSDVSKQQKKLLLLTWEDPSFWETS